MRRNLGLAAIAVVALQGSPTYSIGFDAQPNGLGDKTIVQGTIANGTADPYVYDTNDPNASRADVTLEVTRKGPPSSTEKFRNKHAGVREGQLDGFQPPLVAGDEVKITVRWYSGSGSLLKEEVKVDTKPHQAGL
ncbi:MAG: hypothetical protein H6834_03920 [Planctomycetes bacterium]|nr:hypothetical protein [Planctomycetota bacterium]